MAQFLYDRHSSALHLNTVKRHIRLCRQVKGAEELATTIEPGYNELSTKVAATAKASDDCDIKRDQVLLKDALLDDKVRDLNEACKKYERDNPGENVMALLFPGGLSPVIYAPLSSEPAEVEKLILVINGLGEGHPLAAHVEPLQTAVNECKTALTELNGAVTAEKSAEALESIAKITLERQYERNYYAAGDKFGKRYANRLFPAVSSSAKQAVEEVKN